MGIKQIEQFSDIILRILRFLAESSGVTKLNFFNPFPIVNRVLAGVPTPSDSGKTPQLKTSKLTRNCGKTEVLHLQPSYEICWSLWVAVLLVLLVGFAGSRFLLHPGVDYGLRNGPRSLLTSQCGILIYAMSNSFFSTNNV